jgi:hypothetical protein
MTFREFDEASSAPLPNRGLDIPPVVIGSEWEVDADEARASEWALNGEADTSFIAVDPLLDGSAEELPLREAARALVKDTPEGRGLEEKLEAFDRLDESSKEKAAPEIRKDIADIIARTVTEEHQRTQTLEALANFRTDQTLTASEPAEIQERHPLVAQLLDVVEDVLAELGKEMLIEALLPGAHILLPPTDFIDSIFTAVEMFEIAEDPEPWHHAAWP